MLQRLADLLEQSLEELAQAESKDQGERGQCQPLPSFSCPSLVEPSLVPCPVWKCAYSDAGHSHPPSKLSIDLLPLNHMNRTQDSSIT